MLPSAWTFDSSGGFGDATWTSKDGRWYVKTHSVLRDGKKASATNVITVLDAHTISWQSTHRTLEGEALPDTKVVKMKRVK